MVFKLLVFGVFWLPISYPNQLNILQSTSNIISLSNNRSISKPVKLTLRLILKALPRAERYDIKDSVTSGLRVRIAPTGKKSFIALGKVRSTNQVRVLSLGDTSTLKLEEARIEAATFLAQLRLGLDVREIEAKESEEQAAKIITLNTAMEQYLSDRQLKPSTVKDYRYEIPKYCIDFFNKPIQAISEDIVCKWYLGNNHRKTSIDKAYRSLRAILEYMVGLKVINYNPCKAVTIRKLRYKIKPRTNRIENYNVTKFLDAWLILMVQQKLNPVQGDFILWLLMTGYRLNEARTLKWADLDSEKLAITISDTKNGKPHTLPLTPLMSDLLDRRLLTNPCNNPYIFPAMEGNKFSNIKPLCDCRKSLDKITSLANIPNVRPHDLRRSFTSILDGLEISESNIKSLLNHSDGTVTRKHYLQSTSIEIKRTNLWLVGKYLEKAITVFGTDINTGTEFIYECVGSIREFVYGTAKCDYSIKKVNRTAKNILDDMR
jgi:integrase